MHSLSEVTFSRYHFPVFNWIFKNPEYSRSWPRCCFYKYSTEWRCERESISFAMYIYAVLLTVKLSSPLLSVSKFNLFGAARSTYAEITFSALVQSELCKSICKLRMKNVGCQSVTCMLPCNTYSCKTGLVSEHSIAWKIQHSFFNLEVDL